MSVKVSAWVWEHAPVKSGELVVLLALADNAHDDGGGAYPSQQHLAVKARMGERQTGNCLKALEAKGLIQRQGVLRNGRTVVWRVVIGDPAKSAVPQPAAGRSSNGLPPEPSSEPSSLSLEGAPARELRPDGKPLKYNGKVVPFEVQALARNCLHWFNDAAGRSIGEWRSDGRPSPALREIIGAVLDHGGVTPEQWEAAIRNAVANPPRWTEGQPLQPGDVFGAKAVEHALSNDGVKRLPPAGRGRASASELLRKLG